MKAILTKYHPPTLHRAARVSAQDMDGNRITLSYNSDQISELPNAHRAAAVALCQKMNWTGADTLIAGTLAHNWVFVFPPAPITTLFNRGLLALPNTPPQPEMTEAEFVKRYPKTPLRKF